MTKEMFLHDDEEAYFLPFLTPEKRVLEWGSGNSTIAIAKRVNYLVSIEHDIVWYEKIKKQLSENVYYSLHAPTTEYTWEKNKDGNLTQFAPYVYAPLFIMMEQNNDKKFDIIFIDGRARRYCAEIAVLLSHSKTDIFIHDYQPIRYEGREEYSKVVSVLTFIEQVHDLARFKPKKEFLVIENFEHN